MSKDIGVGSRVRIVRALDPSGAAFVGSTGEVVVRCPANYEEDWEVQLDGDDIVTLFYTDELEAI